MLLGLIGGLGPESTVDYYQRIIATYQRRNGAGKYPEMLINSIDINRALDLLNAEQLEELAALFAREFDRLVVGGAEIGAITANTPHIVFDRVEKLVPIPLVSIVRATHDAARSRGLRKLLLLGTRFTMGARFYPDEFRESGIEMVVPPESEHAAIHDKYMNELVRGTFSDATRRWFVTLIERTRDQEHIDGAILAGTELPLLLRDEAVDGVPLLDTTEIHVETIVHAAYGVRT